jgi:glycosyltransferase involved in cell wall biosynthesis
MKILLVANYENDRQESMQRFAGSMSDTLTRAGHTVRTVRPPSFVGRLRPAGHGIGKWLGYADKFAIFPPALKKAVPWADVVHICDHSNAFYTRHLGSVPHVVTCHDLLAIRSARGETSEPRTRWSGRKLQQMIANGLLKAQHVACVSDATRSDLLRVTGIPEQRVSRIYNSLNYPYSRMETGQSAARLRKLSIEASTPFLLHVGGNQWYKNRLGVLRIFASLKQIASLPALKLVMAGKPWTEEMRDFVANAGIAQSTLELPEVSNEDLRALYSSARFLLFPSLQEGFGWPIIEAQACGCPVITSNRVPMTEVGGEAAIYIDPQDSESAARMIHRSFHNGPSLSESGLRNASRFHTGHLIESYLATYDLVREESLRAARSIANRRSAFVHLS